MRIGANPLLASMRRRLLIASTVAVALLFASSLLLFLPIVSLPSVYVPSTSDLLHNAKKVDLAGCEPLWCPLARERTVNMTGSVTYWLSGVGGVTVDGRYMLESRRLPVPLAYLTNQT